MKPTLITLVAAFAALTVAKLPAASISGDAVEVGSDIRHANGNVYDQVMLAGASATVAADAGQIVRVSYLDQHEDIVQVEFSGSGSLSISLDAAAGPMPAIKYNQPGVEYMRGLASISITGSDATSNISVFAVGRITAINQSLFRSDVSYDGYADIARIVIEAANSAEGSRFGAIRTGNAHYFATRGYAGIYAPNVHMQGAVVVGDVTAFDDATPALVIGAGSIVPSVTIAGGNLLQPNDRSVELDVSIGILRAPGTDAQGRPLVSVSIDARFASNGIDISHYVRIFTLVGASTPVATPSPVAWAVAVVQAVVGNVGAGPENPPAIVTPVTPTIVPSG